MATELPRLHVELIATGIAAGRPVLINRDPGPSEVGVPLTSTIAFEIVDSGVEGIDRSWTRVWVNGVLAFDGTTTPEVQAGFGGPRAAVNQTSDTLRIELDPLTPFESEQVVAVDVLSRKSLGTGTLDETYTFSAEDRTAPRLVAAVATSPRLVRLTFDERVVVVDPVGFVIRALTAPAVPLEPTSAVASSEFLDLEVAPEMTPGATYQITAVGVTDGPGNAVSPPFDTVTLRGFQPAVPSGRAFDLWSTFPKYNRRADLTGDLARFVACLQEVTDLLLADIDRFPDIFDIERAPEAWLDLILEDLGNPFAFDLEVVQKRRLASMLVEMYQLKGTVPGIKNAVRFFLGIEITAVTAFAATALILGESEFGVDWELGPSDTFARYAFNVVVERVLSEIERKQLRTLVEYMRPAHTHLVDVIEPLTPEIPDHWELGASEVGVSTDLH